MVYRFFKNNVFAFLCHGLWKGEVMLNSTNEIWIHGITHLESLVCCILVPILKYNKNRRVELLTSFHVLKRIYFKLLIMMNTVTVI